MSKRQIVNIINFIRGIEPRMEMDLITPVKEQIRLIDKYNFSATFLIQYDALLMPEYQKLLLSLDSKRYEIGVWFEIVQPLTEKCGISWTGRFPWDWHCHCGFSVGYTHSQKQLLLDELFNRFKEIFGYYPRVFGSWFFDSFTARYAADTYGLDAMCNCKEQYGTDGYTLWGGYYGQGYYPSRTNVFMPAQTAGQQLNVPVFRMLGSDPVYQYDFGLDLSDGAEQIQRVITLEPVYNASTGGGGGLPAWVDWYLAENYNGDCLSFGYTQAGQENSFGWDAMKDGLSYQFARFDELSRQGLVNVETLGTTGRWFKETYSMTPASAITAYTAFDDVHKKSVWYCTKHYRINLYQDKQGLRIRDLHIFAEDYADPYENTVCTSNDATYETLPVVDGNLNSGNGILSGLYLCDASDSKISCMQFSEMTFSDLENNRASVLFTDGSREVMFLLEENAVEIHSSADFVLRHEIGKKSHHLPAAVACSDAELDLNYHSRRYGIVLESGCFADPHTIIAQDSIIRARFINGNR